MRTLPLLLALLVGISTSASAQTAVVEYYHLDGVGSVRAVTNQAGQVVRSHNYFAFGDGPDPAPPSTQDPLRFVGKPRDAETGLDYFGARHYRARSGRFTTVDPVMILTENLFDPQQWNRYAYSRNNPLRFIDPDGRAPQDQARTAAEGAVVSAGAVFTNDGLARGSYVRQAAELTGPGASEAREALRRQTYGKLTPWGRAVTDSLMQSRVGQLDGKTAAQLAGSASRTSAGVNALGGAARVVGPGLLVVGVGGSAYAISSAPAGGRARAAAGEVGAWSGAVGGGLAGAKAGAVVGTVFGPGPGTAIGATAGTLVGGAIGAVAGSRVGTAVYDRLFR